MLQLDQAWQSWLTENVARGCSSEAMIDTMVSAGFDRSTATGAVLLFSQAESNAASAVPAPDTRRSAAAKVTNYQYDPIPIASGNRIDLGDREAKVLMRCERPQIVVFGDVFSHEECDELIRRSRDKVERSTIVNPITGARDVIDDRSSKGTYFNLCEDDFIATLDRRIARLMNWPMENGEGFQVLHYNVGAEYRAHFDYFPPTDSGSAPHLAVAGQRVSTLVMYLNDVDEGGETYFPDVGVAVTPSKGGAAYFRYFNQLGQLDPLTLHGGAPVVKGEKWIMTKWMRERRYG